MKAAVFYGKHDLRIEELPIPEPKPREALLRVRACGICGTDLHIFHGDEGAAQTPPGTALGHEFAGEIVKTGAGVTEYAAGDRLFVPLNPISRGLYYQKSARVNDLVLQGGFNMDDTIEVTLPEGYGIESLPEDLVLETDWGRFESRCRVGDGVVTVRQRLQLHRFRTDKSRYGEYKDFAKKVNKAMDAKFVLKK